MLWLGNQRASASQVSGKATAAFFAAALGEVCPGCKLSLAGHKFAEFASLAIREDNQGERLHYFEAFKCADWNLLAQHQSFEGTRDALITYAVECALGHNTLVVTRDPSELYDNLAVVTFALLATNDFEQIRSLIAPDSWEQF